MMIFVNEVLHDVWFGLRHLRLCLLLAMQADVTFLAETPEVVLLLHFLNSLMYLQLGSWGKCLWQTGGSKHVKTVKWWLHQHSLPLDPVNLTQTLQWPLQVWFDYLSPAPHRHGWGFCRCTAVVLVTGGSSSCSCTVDARVPHKVPWPTETQPCCAWWTSVWSLHRWFGHTKKVDSLVELAWFFSQVSRLHLHIPFF